MHWIESLTQFTQVWLTLPLIIIPCQIGQIKLKGRIKKNKHFNKDIALLKNIKVFLKMQLTLKFSELLKIHQLRTYLLASS